MKTIEIISSEPLDIAGWSNLNCVVAAKESRPTSSLSFKGYLLNLNHSE